MDNINGRNTILLCIYIDGEVNTVHVCYDDFKELKL